MKFLTFYFGKQEILMKLDILTIAFLTSLLMITQTLAVLVQFLINKAYKGIGWWLVGSIAQAIGFILMSLLYVKGFSFFIMFANPLVFAGQTFLYIGITKLLKINENKWYHFLSNIVFNISYFYFIFVNNSITGRTVVVLTGATILSIITAHRLFFNSKKKVMGSARFTASIFFFYGCFCLARIIFTISYEHVTTYESLLQNTIHIIGFIAPSIVATLWTFGFILIVNEMLVSDTREAKEEAEKASQVKERFLTSMSHEIRTPLNGIMGMIQVMKFTEMDEAQKKYMTTIGKESKILLNLLNNILDYSKLKHGKDVLNIEKVDVREMIKELKTFFSVKIKQEVDILFYTEESVPKIIMADKIKLQAILINLLGNAIKFTEEGYILLRVSSHGEANYSSITFSVEDTGIGMSQAVMDKLFLEFSQADGQNTRKYGGTGLGLSISKELVALMDGEIYVDSVENKGSNFSFNFPCEVFEKNTPRKHEIDGFFINKNLTFNKNFIDALESIGIANIHVVENLKELKNKIENQKKSGKKFVVFINENTDEKCNENNFLERVQEFSENIIYFKRIENNLDSNLIRTIEFPIEQEELYSAIKDINEGLVHRKQEVITDYLPIIKEDVSIMVIEDNIPSREVLKELFQQLNVQADLFDNGTDAIKKMREKDYDILITDIELPDMNGFDILEKLRIIDDEKGKHTNVIATTAHTLDGFGQKCLQAGMDEYIAKPIDFNELCAIINKYAKKTEKIIGLHRELEIIKKVEPIAFRDARASLEKIKSFLDDDRYDEIKKEAHKLKGSFSSIRRKNIEDIALEIFMFAGEKNKEMILRNIDKIAKEIILYENSCNRG